MSDKPTDVIGTATFSHVPNGTFTLADRELLQAIAKTLQSSKYGNGTLYAAIEHHVQQFGDLNA